MLTDSFSNKLRKLCKSILNEEIPLDINDIQCMLLSKLSKRKIKKKTRNCYIENLILHDLLHKDLKFLIEYVLDNQINFFQLNKKMSENINKLQLVDHVILTNLSKTLQENATIQRSK